jgi:hypothetical protein
MLIDQEQDATIEQIRSMIDGIGDPDERCAFAEMRAVIAAIIFESPEHLDCRHLWTAGRFSYFRVNRWSGLDVGVGHIRHSAFVSVETLPHGWRVHGLIGTESDPAPRRSSGMLKRTLSASRAPEPCPAPRLTRPCGIRAPSARMKPVL